MILLISVVAGIVPMVIYAFILYWFDRYEKEPLGLLLASFLWGFIPAALFALITQVIFDLPLSVFFAQGALAYELVSASIIAPVTEEFIKGAAVLLIAILARREFDTIFDGVLYGSLVGFGFAAIENILYFATIGYEAGLGSLFFIIFMRAILFGLNHAFFTSLTGMGLAVARLSRSAATKIAAPLLGLSAAIVAHGIHNAGATMAAATGFALLLAILADWTGVLFVLVVIIVSIRRERKWLLTQLRDEVQLGTLTHSQYAVVTSLARRAQVRGRTFTRGDMDTWRKLGRYYRICTELAYKKHQNARAGERGAPTELIAQLRETVEALSRQF